MRGDGCFAATTLPPPGSNLVTVPDSPRASFDSTGACRRRCRLTALARLADDAARFSQGGADGGIRLKPRDSRARQQAWSSCGGGSASAARTLCSSGPVQVLAIDGKEDSRCLRMMAVLKVLPSSAASTKSLRVEKRRALELGGEVRAAADGNDCIWHSPQLQSKFEIKPGKRRSSKQQMQRTQRSEPNAPLKSRNPGKSEIPRKSVKTNEPDVAQSLGDSGSPLLY